MYQAGLILEGGGMKGLYTTGVLDFFLEKGVSFSSCYGVSAGAIYMCSYLAGQKERGLRTATNYLKDKHYCGMYSLLTTGDYFGVDFCYNKMLTELDPIDNETFKKQKTKAYAVITNIITGQPEYYQIKDVIKDIIGVRASSSLPLISRNVMIHGRPYLDGGISDSIPIRRSIQDGNTKNVIILNKQEGFVRKKASFLKPIKLKYRKYPKLYEDMANRHEVYNETMDFIQKQQREGKAFVIRPREELGVKRLENDAEKLKKVYRIGYEDARKAYESMLSFLKTNK